MGDNKTRAGADPPATKADPGVPRRRGRPPSPAKRAHMLRVATRVFLDRGYDAASMDLVALRAGVSKATVYSHFTSKHALFGAIIDALARSLLVDIDRLAVNEMSPAQMLRLFGRAYLELALATRSLAVHRLVIAEAARRPGLGKVIYRNGPVRLVASLGAYLERQPSLDIRDAELAAEQFLGMVLGNSQLRLLLGAKGPRQARADIDRLVEHAVEIFLRGTLASRRHQAALQ